MNIFKRLLLILTLSLISHAAFAQGVSGIATFAGQSNPAPYQSPAASTYIAGSLSASSLVETVQGGPVWCAGQIQQMAQTQLSLAANSTLYIYYRCNGGTVATASYPPQGYPNILIAAVVTGASTVSTTTDLRSLTNFVVTADGTFFVPESACSGAVTGTAGTGNATDILAGSGGVRVFRLSSTNAGASVDTFTCNFQIPSQLTAGHGSKITDITFLVSNQTTQATSVTLPTLKSWTPPAPVDPETANSATFAAFGGTITQAPTSAQFAAYTAVAAGQFFSINAALGTPTLINTDLLTLQFVIAISQSASAAMVLETPGFYVHYAHYL